MYVGRRVGSTSLTERTGPGAIEVQNGHECPASVELFCMNFF